MRVRAHNSLFVLTFVLACASPSSAASILFDGAKVSGVSGVTVAGTLYDVSFIDGTCASLYSGCDAAGDFLFQTQGDAVAAGQALLPLITFFDPEDIRGCESTIGCRILIPYQPLDNSTQPTMAYLRNEPGTVNDFVSAGFNLFRTTDTTSLSGDVYGVWRLHDDTGSGPGTPSVPEPGSMALWTGAFVVTACARRRRRAAQAPGHRASGIEA